MRKRTKPIYKKETVRIIPGRWYEIAGSAHFKKYARLIEFSPPEQGTVLFWASEVLEIDYWGKLMYWQNKWVRVHNFEEVPEELINEIKAKAI